MEMKQHVVCSRTFQRVIYLPVKIKMYANEHSIEMNLMTTGVNNSQRSGRVHQISCISVKIIISIFILSFVGFVMLILYTLE